MLVLCVITYSFRELNEFDASINITVSHSLPIEISLTA